MLSPVLVCPYISSMAIYFITYLIYVSDFRTTVNGIRTCVHNFRTRLSDFRSFYPLKRARHYPIPLKKCPDSGQ